MPLRCVEVQGEYSGQTDASRSHPEGRGILFACDGSVLVEGRWKDGQIVEGRYLGIVSQETYSGHFKNDKKHGYGIYTWASGDKYDGEWVSNKKHGHGIQTWADGTKYEGEWVSDN